MVSIFPDFDDVFRREDANVMPMPRRPGAR
jgi:hypothetical protein